MKRHLAPRISGDRWRMTPFLRRTLPMLLVPLLLACVPLPASPMPQRILNVGMILGQGGLGDRSFNDSAYAGLQEAQRLYGIRFQALDHTPDDEANLAALRRLIRLGYDLIIGIGFGTLPISRRSPPNFPSDALLSWTSLLRGITSPVSSIASRRATF